MALLFTIISVYSAKSKLPFIIFIIIFFSCCNGFLLTEILWLYRVNQSKQLYIKAWKTQQTENVKITSDPIGVFKSYLVKYGLPFLMFSMFALTIFFNFVYTIIVLVIMIIYSLCRTYFKKRLNAIWNWIKDR